MLLRRSSSLRLKITYSAWFRNVHKDGEKKGSGAQKFRAALQGERIIFEFETWWGSYKKGIFAHYSQSDVSTDSLTRRLDENLPCFWFDNNLDGSSTGPFFFIQCHQGFLIIHVLDCLKAPVKRWNRQNHNGGFVGEFSGSFFSPQCKRQRWTGTIFSARTVIKFTMDVFFLLTWITLLQVVTQQGIFLQRGAQKYGLSRHQRNLFARSQNVFLL